METKKFEKKKVGSSIEPPSAKSYSSASGRFFHSGLHIISGIICMCGAQSSTQGLPPELVMLVALCFLRSFLLTLARVTNPSFPKQAKSV